MPGCVLNIFGTEFDVEGYLSNTPFRTCAVWRKGETKFKGRPASKRSGFNVVVSEAPGSAFSVQVQDATEFLGKHQVEIKHLTSHYEIDDMTLDFGLDLGDDPVQVFLIPISLSNLCASLNVRIALSVYLSWEGLKD